MMDSTVIPCNSFLPEDERGEYLSTGQLPEMCRSGSLMSLTWPEDNIQAWALFLSLREASLHPNSLFFLLCSVLKNQCQLGRIPFHKSVGEQVGEL